MADHKSAIKRHKQSLVRRERNRVAKSALKTATKKVEASLTENKADEAAQSLKKVTIALDKAARKGIIHKNAAARTKSRLSKKVNALAA